MSSVTFRESVVVMIDTSRTHIRAGLGLHDLLRTPAIVRILLSIVSVLCSPHWYLQEIPACVGIRQSNPLLNGDSDAQPQASSSKTTTVSAKVTDYLVGTQLDDAIANGQDVTVYWPFAEGNIRDWTQAEALWCANHVLAPVV